MTQAEPSRMDSESGPSDGPRWTNEPNWQPVMIKWQWTQTKIDSPDPMTQWPNNWMTWTNDQWQYWRRKAQREGLMIDEGPVGRTQWRKIIEDQPRQWLTMNGEKTANDNDDNGQTVINWTDDRRTANPWQTMTIVNEQWQTMMTQLTNEIDNDPAQKVESQPNDRWAQRTDPKPDEGGGKKANETWQTQTMTQTVDDQLAMKTQWTMKDNWDYCDPIDGKGPVTQTQYWRRTVIGPRPASWDGGWPGLTDPDCDPDPAQWRSRTLVWTHWPVLTDPVTDQPRQWPSDQRRQCNWRMTQPRPAQWRSNWNDQTMTVKSGRMTDRQWRWPN